MSRNRPWKRGRPFALDFNEAGELVLKIDKGRFTKKRPKVEAEGEPSVQ